MHLSNTQAGIVVVGLVFFIALCWWADKMREEFDNCPKLILGYGHCDLWYQKPCDHSPEAVYRAKAAMRRD